MSPRVSVLMPALNEEQAIESAIRSVLDQRDVDLELLVIVGRSVDRTEELVAAIARNDERVRMLANPRSTIPAALNIGLRHSRGRYVARIDAHSSTSPDYLHRGVQWLESDHRLASVGGIRIGVSTRATGRAVAYVLSSPYAIGNSINHFAKSRQLTDHASFGVTRADRARAVGGWDESLLVNEDVDFDHRLRAAGHLIGFDPDMKIYWRVQDSLPSLFRQFRRYGRGKGQMIRKNGWTAIRLRHLVPPLALVGGTGVLLAGFVRPRWWALLTPYLLGVGAASGQVWWRHRHEAAHVTWPVVPAGFVTVHSAWGLGMLEGSIRGRNPTLASGNSAVRSHGPESSHDGAGADERSDAYRPDQAGEPTTSR